MDENETLTETLTSPENGASEVADISKTPEYLELYNQYVRLAADFENFRKRQAQERESLFKYGAQTTVESILPVLDNLERAQTSLNAQSSPEMLYKSFEMLNSQLLEALKSVGLEKMTPVGEPFDPLLHEALSQQESTEVPDQSVLQVYQAGYRLHDRVIRAARVVVASAPEGTNSPNTGFAPEALSQKPNPFSGE